MGYLAVKTDPEGQQTVRESTLAKRSLFLIIILVLSIAGIAVSIQLTSVHYRTHTDPTYHSVCAVNEKVNCETVAQSPYSVFAGVPVSVLGLFAYAMIALLAGWGLSKKRLAEAWPIGALFWLSAAAFAASALLGYISWKLIDALCIFCLALYIINTALLIACGAFFLSWRLSPLAPLIADLKALFSRPLAAGGLILCSGCVLAALIVFIPPYWQHPGWKDLPELPTGQDEQGCHWIGAENPLVTVIEFSDYQCPYCRQAHKQMRHEAAKYPGTVRLIHNHLPLDQACNEAVKRSFHDRACEFSKAAECAAEQDKFWEMNDALFSIQETVSAEEVDIDRLAVQLGLDRSAFNDCMSSEGIPECILKDIDKARQRNVKATPTFFIGAQPYPGGIPQGVLEQVIERARNKKK